MLPNKLKFLYQFIVRAMRGFTNSLNSSNTSSRVNSEIENCASQSELAFEEIHKLSVKNGWKDGDPKKIALHALVGGIMSELTGSGFTAGAEGAGFNELVQKELSKITDPAIRQWASYIIGSATGTTGRIVAIYGTKYNDLNEDPNSIYTEMKKFARFTVPNWAKTKWTGPGVFLKILFDDDVILDPGTRDPDTPIPGEE